MSTTEPTVITEPGVYDLDDATYHADPVPGGSLSNSGAKLLLPPSCPAIFRWHADHPEPPKKAFDIGTAAHKLVLGDGPELVCVDAENWRTKAAQEKRDRAYAIGAVPLLAADYERVEAMAAALRRHPVASALFDPARGRPEQSLFWRDADTGIWRRARLDWLPDPAGRRLVIGDYKSCASAEPGAVAKAMAKYGYYRQAPWYLDAVTALGLAGDHPPAFVFCFQEKDPPHLITIAQPNDDAMTWGRAMNRKALDVYRDCTRKGEWPAYSSDVISVALPRWAEYEHEAAYADGYFDDTTEETP